MLRKVLLAASAVALCLMLSSPATAQDGAGATARGTGGAVASVDERASQIGIDVLKAGGNAVDAAVAVMAALGFIEPYSCGIGGGGFMVIYWKETGEVITIDGRETAPLSANVKMFEDPDNPGNNLPFAPNRISNGAAVGVPGTVALWARALERYGTKSLAELLAPTIALAENGIEVDAVFAAQTEQNKARFAAFTSTAEVYLVNGEAPAVGSIHRNPDLAKTYRLIAEGGVRAFYRGEIAEAIVKTVQNPPTVPNPPFRVISGGMTLADLSAYDAIVRRPVVTDYRGHKVYGMGLPSSGGITPAQVLNIIEGYDLKNIDRAQAWHYVIEAMRLAYADRGAFLGDPEYVDAPLTGLLSKEYAAQRRALIGERAPENVVDFRARAGDPLPFQKDTSPSRTADNVEVTFSDAIGGSTTHLTVADKDGNVVSVTFTIESIGGSGIVVPGYGFLLNNELTDFDLADPHPNSPEPGKRPRSSMGPTIVIAPDGTVMAFGSPGGATIITTVLTIAVNMIDFGLSLDEAIAAPRISQRNTGFTQVDSKFEESDLGKALIALGHELRGVAEIGAATGIVVKPDGTMLAAAEPQRRGGGAAMVVQSAN
ncbi:MAG: gamma-glutamyltransferase [Candidatus Thermofonsia Clade 1 bacterium]|uniref:Glutathione hydrolase proenzyme n=1 Tax=Candidatus Thermofonsia Clade 1 bacterium TaxID=2364210 RepID=A0A2M8P2T8_9CHLR|nr:MAG: gamma-glutamyltransferase [Candidatus Thermofonsia Clade 1 bacterium]